MEMEMMEAVEENTQANKSPIMAGDQLVGQGGEDPEADPLHPQEVDVAGHRILKPTVKVPSPPLPSLLHSLSPPLGLAFLTSYLPPQHFRTFMYYSLMCIA
jgi:hypothetical protein